MFSFVHICWHFDALWCFQVPLLRWFLAIAHRASLSSASLLCVHPGNYRVYPDDRPSVFLMDVRLSGRTTVMRLLLSISSHLILTCRIVDKDKWYADKT